MPANSRARRRLPPPGSAATSARTHLLTGLHATDAQAARKVAGQLRDAAAAAASEKGHLTYDVFEVRGDPATLYVHETWASAEDARRHAGLGVTRDGADRITPLLAGGLDTVELIPLASHGMKLSGHEVLITGAGTGTGLEAARQFSRRGNRVIMVARNEDRLQRESSQLGGTVAYACDITDEAQVARLFDFLAREHPSLDMALLNAGVTHTYRLFGGEDMLAHAEEEMRTNYFSAIRLIGRLVPVLEARADPVLIVTTSGVAFAPDISNPTYSTTKAALHSLTQAVRLQLERDGSKIKVFEFMAPLVDTPFAANVASDAKVPAAEAVDEMLSGIERDILELHVGITKDAYATLKRSSDAAVRAVNAATGG